MIFVDLAHKKPTDSDIPDWEPWPYERWQAWLDKSKALVEEMTTYENDGKHDERNQVIDANRNHWSELKPWLQALSGGKCWFTGVKELYSHYDVEHFRPKKEARRHDGHTDDGYWWLAFDYMNFRLCGNVGNRKKGGWFPLKDDSICSTPDDPREEMEVPYLLDPIDPNDVDLIGYDEEGKVTIADPQASEWDHQRVSATVTRLKLNDHVALAEERRKVWQKMDRLIEHFRDTKARCRTGNNPAAKERLRGVRQDIRAMVDPVAPLSSVAKWCLLVRNDPQLARLAG